MRNNIKWLLAASLAFTSFSVNAQTRLNHYQPGFRTINGSQLNLMVDQVNSIAGNSSTLGRIQGSGVIANNSTGNVTLPTPPTGTNIRAAGQNATASRILAEAWGGLPVFTTRRADGTIAAPTNIVNTDEIGSYNFHGATSASAFYGPAARVSALATEDWSGTAGGTKLVFSTTPNTTQTITDALTIGQDQSATFSGLLRTTFGTPTIASGACGTTTNGVITSGTNQAGLVTIGAATTTTCTISFSATLPNAPNACVVFPASAGGAATGTTVARVSSITTSQFVITGSALASTAYYYLCI